MSGEIEEVKNQYESWGKQKNRKKPNSFLNWLKENKRKNVGKNLKKVEVVLDVVMEKQK